VVDPNLPAKPKFDAYTGMMLGSCIALIIAVALLWIELDRYGGWYNYCWKTPTSGATGS